METVPIFWRPPALLILSTSALVAGIVVFVLARSPERSLKFSAQMGVAVGGLGAVAADLVYRRRKGVSLLCNTTSALYLVPTWLVGLAGAVGIWFVDVPEREPTYQVAWRFAQALREGRAADARSLAAGPSAQAAVDACEAGGLRARKVLYDTRGPKWLDPTRAEIILAEDAWVAPEVSLSGPPDRKAHLAFVVIQDQGAWKVESFDETVDAAGPK